MRESISALLQSENTEIVAVATLAEALEHIENFSFDCVVTDLALPDGTGYDLLERLAGNAEHASLPVIVYTGRMLSDEDEHRLRRYSKSIIIKGAKSPERLLDEVTLFLHSVESSLAPEQQRMLRTVRQRDNAFEGRTILLAEDDVRNIFALSHVIEPLGAKLQIARNGREALEALESGPEVHLILMDIMMPEMDGLTAMGEILCTFADHRVDGEGDGERSPALSRSRRRRLRVQADRRGQARCALPCLAAPTVAANRLRQAETTVQTRKSNEPVRTRRTATHERFRHRVEIAAGGYLPQIPARFPSLCDVVAASPSVSGTG
jgi:CheY-like chemotaxis protein